MKALIFRCPSTGQRVQGFIAEDVSDPGGEAYEAVACAACKSVHLVNPVNGRTIGADDD